jgi:hypothetical protein
MKKRKWFLPSSILSAVHTDIKTMVQSDPLHIYMGDFTDTPPDVDFEWLVPDPPKVRKKPGPKPKPKPDRPNVKATSRRRKTVPVPKKKSPPVAPHDRTPMGKGFHAPGIPTLMIRPVDDDDFHYLIRRDTNQYTRCPAVAVFREKLEELLDRGMRWMRGRSSG